MNPAPLEHWFPELAQRHPVVIAGPCSAENEGQVIDVALQLKALPLVKIFRAGIWKPRTRPNSFEGVGERGLPWLQRVKAETGFLTTVEVANAKHVEAALKHEIDILWIGARTTVNPFSVQEIAEVLRGVGVAVFVKNPVNADLSLWLGALERLANAGVNKLGAIHRGFSTFEKNKYKNPPMWKIPIELKSRLPSLPLFCDPSHICGTRQWIESVCQKAMDMGMQGVMVETHNNPKIALSDAEQQVTPQQLKEILERLIYRSPHSESQEFEVELAYLRSQIDRIDLEILEALQMRMKVVEQIGQAKLAHDITPLQVDRVNELMNHRLESARSLGLRENYIKDIFHTIHEESVQFQTALMAKNANNINSPSCTK
jgi:chorismate mutase